jgi:hypothetical protein
MPSQWLLTCAVISHHIYHAETSKNHISHHKIKTLSSVVNNFKTYLASSTLPTETFKQHAVPSKQRLRIQSLQPSHQPLSFSIFIPCWKYHSWWFNPIDKSAEQRHANVTQWVTVYAPRRPWPRWWSNWQLLGWLSIKLWRPIKDRREAEHTAVLQLTRRNELYKTKWKLTADLQSSCTQLGINIIKNYLEITYFILSVIICLESTIVRCSIALLCHVQGCRGSLCSNPMCCNAK